MRSGSFPSDSARLSASSGDTEAFTSVARRWTAARASPTVKGNTATETVSIRFLASSEIVANTFGQTGQYSCQSERSAEASEARVGDHPAKRSSRSAGRSVQFTSSTRMRRGSSAEQSARAFAPASGSKQECNFSKFGIKCLIKCSVRRQNFMG